MTIEELFDIDTSIPAPPGMTLEELAEEIPLTDQEKMTIIEQKLAAGEPLSLEEQVLMKKSGLQKVDPEKEKKRKKKAKKKVQTKEEKHVEDFLNKLKKVKAATHSDEEVDEEADKAWEEEEPEEKYEIQTPEQKYAYGNQKKFGNYESWRNEAINILNKDHFAPFRPWSAQNSRHIISFLHNLPNHPTAPGLGYSFKDIRDIGLEELIAKHLNQFPKLRSK